MDTKFSIKQKAAQAVSLQILEFMLENEYIDSDIVEEIKDSGDIDYINDIAYYQLSLSCALYGSDRYRAGRKAIQENGK